MSVILLTMLGFIALWWALRLLPAGADGHGPLPYLIAFVRFLWIPTTLILAVAILARQWTAAAIAAALTALIGFFASSWYRNIQDRKAMQNGQNDTTTADGSEPVHTVMTLNCQYGAANPQAIIEAVRSNGVSVLALQELTTNLVDALDNAGLASVLPYRQLGEPKANDNGGFNGLWLRSAPENASDSSVDITAASVPRVVVGGTAIYSAHTKSPMRGCSEWSQGAINLTATYPTPNDGNTCQAVIMGDLNSNLDHPSFRTLIGGGYRDIILSITHAHAASFPRWLLWPRLELDHILVTPGISSSNVRTLIIPDTDHLALLAALRLNRN
jgi:hypothetical protein